MSPRIPLLLALCLLATSCSASNNNQPTTQNTTRGDEANSATPTNSETNASLDNSETSASPDNNATAPAEQPKKTTSPTEASTAASSSSAVALGKPLVKVRKSGGMCMEGPCFREIVVYASGAYTRHSQKIHGARPTDPLAGKLSKAQLATLRGALGKLDADKLQEGYGRCCKSHMDGQDDFLFFYDANGLEQRKVRVTDPNAAPPDLRTLQTSLWALW